MTTSNGDYCAGPCKTEGVLPTERPGDSGGRAAVGGALCGPGKEKQRRNGERQGERKRKVHDPRRGHQENTEDPHYHFRSRKIRCQKSEKMGSR